MTTSNAGQPEKHPAKDAIQALALEFVIASHAGLQPASPLAMRSSDVMLGILYGLGLSAAAPEWAHATYVNKIAASDRDAPGLGTGLRSEHQRLAARFARLFPVSGMAQPEPAESEAAS